MTPNQKLTFARQRYSAANRALNAVRAKRIVGIGSSQEVRLGSSTITVHEGTVDLNATERARLCRRANRLLRVVDMIAARHGLSLAL